MSEQQYLQKKAAQFLSEYDQQVDAACKYAAVEVLLTSISVIGLGASIVQDSVGGTLISAIVGLGSGIPAFNNLVYLIYNRDCKTEEDKNRALAKMLDEKIAATKEQIKRYTELYDSRNRK